ncbi:MAG: YARHG domain-containing protein [Clostridium sp.]
MNCSKCGFQIDDSTKFCPKCGDEMIQDNLLYQEKISITYENGTQEEDTLETITPKKNKLLRSFVIIFSLILILVSVGYASYYFSFEKYNIITPKKSDKSPLKRIDTTSQEKISDKVSDIPASTVETDTTKSNHDAKSDGDANYIFTKSSSEKLLESVLATLSKENLALARNEIYARHGYVFKSQPLNSYFDSKTWYKPNTSFKGLNGDFNAVESYNINLITKHE